MKNSRQGVILKIIQEKSIETQAQLIEALAERGISSTQATLSRDIRELSLVKELGKDGKYRYTESNKSKKTEHEERLRKIFKESVFSYNVAQNLVVIKTLPGLANAACAALDTMNLENIVGTLAGDDTAFLAMNDFESAKEFCRRIDEMIKA